ALRPPAGRGRGGRRAGRRPAHVLRGRRRRRHAHGPAAARLVPRHPAADGLQDRFGCAQRHPRGSFSPAATERTRTSPNTDHPVTTSRPPDGGVPVAAAPTSERASPSRVIPWICTSVPSGTRIFALPNRL